MITYEGTNKDIKKIVIDLNRAIKNKDEVAISILITRLNLLGCQFEETK